MEKLEPYFPLNKSVKSGDIQSLVIAIVIYVVIAAVLGIIFSIVSTLVWIYEVVGIVLAIMTYIK